MEALRLIEICEAIGCVAEWNAHATDGLARMLDGCPIEDLTVGELIAAIAVRREEYNQIHKSEEAER